MARRASVIALDFPLIDHVLVREATPLSGDVFDFGVWSTEDEVERIEANLVNTGSDHFPVGAVAAPGSG